MVACRTDNVQQGVALEAADPDDDEFLGQAPCLACVALCTDASTGGAGEVLGQVVAHLDDGTEGLQQLGDAGASNDAALGDEPADRTVQNALVVAQNGEPCIQRGLRGQFAVQLSCGAQLEELASDDEGACDGIDTDVELLHHAVCEGDTADVDQLVSDAGADDFLTQRVRVQVLTETLDQCCREVAAQNAFQVGVVREVGLLQCVGEVNLHVRSQDGQLGAGQAVAGGLQALVQLLVSGQELDGAVQTGVLFQVVHEALVQVGTQDGTVELTLQQDVLLDIGLEHLAADLVLQGLDEGSTLFNGQFAVCNEAVHQNLDVDLAVTGFHTCGVVDCVGVEDDAVERSLNTTQLGEAEVTTLANNLGAQVLAVDAQCVVSLVANLCVGLGGGLHVGTDTTVVNQVNRRLQDCGNQLGRCQLGDGLIQAQNLAHLGGDLDGLQTARVHATTGGNQVAVVVLPGGTGQVVQALTLVEGHCRVRVRVQEDVAVVECCDQAGCLGAEQTVTEHVTGHVANADCGELFGLSVVAELSEVTLDGLPSTACGDAHCLVVVADGAAGCERVAQPEAALQADCVCGVRECCGALVRCNHQVVVVSVACDNALGADNSLGAVSTNGEVVGDVQQGADEDLVGLATLGDPCVAIHCGVGQLLGVETTLRTGGDNDSVLHHLCLDQAQNLGAEVVTAVRPAQATTCDATEAQVNTLNARGVDENLELGAGQGCEVDLLRCHLERECGAVSKVCVGAQDSADDLAKGTQVAVSVQGGDLVQFLNQGCFDFLTACVALLIVEAVVRVEADLEELDQVLGDGRVCEQGVRHEGRGVAQAQLNQVVVQGTEQTYFLPGQALSQDQAVQGIGLALTEQVGVQGILVQGSHSVCVHALGEFNSEVVEVTVVFAILRLELVGLLINNDQAHILHNRQKLGEGVRCGQVGLQSGGVGFAGFNLDCGGLLARERFKNHDILDCLFYCVIGSVGCTSRICPG